MPEILQGGSLLIWNRLKGLIIVSAPKDISTSTVGSKP